MGLVLKPQSAPSIDGNLSCGTMAQLLALRVKEHYLHMIKGQQKNQMEKHMP